ncbi:hypothetical protein RhiirA4_484470 [Rhizophagus irregularis]|uniref:Uncharacterized protein n=1 Tax=Rhizophagus irregularis TaxID=588596 RepID=A0A2I1HP53_9GLOM|nr:hypothetical protein RhiirA4_484470 [Rhizophagus irregularis]
MSLVMKKINIKPLSPSADSSYYKKTKMLEENWEKNTRKITLFARTVIDLDLNKKVIIFLPLSGTENKHISISTVVITISRKSFSRARNINEGSELLVDDASYPHLYLITHDKINAFDVKWEQNEDYGGVAERDNMWCIINDKTPRINHDFDTEKLILISSLKDLHIIN